MAKVGKSNQDRTISLKAAVRSCINTQGNEKVYQKNVNKIKYWVSLSCIGKEAKDITKICYSC